MNKLLIRKGKVKIGAHSGLRKLARAMRRGKVPDERQAIIDIAMRNAAKRAEVYMHSMARSFAGFRKLMAARA